MTIPNISNSEQGSSTAKKNESINFKKLVIPKFAGDCIKFTCFWKTFKCAIRIVAFQKS